MCCVSAASNIHVSVRSGICSHIIPILVFATHCVIMAGASPVQLAKRAFVVALRALAAVYTIGLSVTRDSSDRDVEKAFRKVAARVHPDKGGSTSDSQRLHAARDAWREAQNTATCPGRPKHAGGPPQQAGQWASVAPLAAAPRKEYRIRGESILLTYQGLPPTALSEWSRFKDWVPKNLKAWSAKHWCATLETNEDGSSHLHLMLQFTKPVDFTVMRFVFEGHRPNASSSDYLGEGVCKKRMQLSINRGMFYVYADKLGTQQDKTGALCVAGNYQPCWEEGCSKYQVLGRWADSLWKQRKLSHQNYERYVFLCRDNVLGRKRNLDAVREFEQEKVELKDIEANTKRLRSNKKLYKPFPRVAQVEAWLALFQARVSLVEGQQPRAPTKVSS